MIILFLWMHNRGKIRYMIHTQDIELMLNLVPEEHYKSIPEESRGDVLLKVNFMGV